MISCVFRWFNPSKTFIELQSGWGWKGPLEIILYNIPAQAEPPHAGCLAVCPDGVWISVRSATPALPWAACASALSPSQWECVFWCSKGTLWVSISAHCPSDPSALHAEQSLLSQPLPTGELLQSLDHFCDPLLDSSLSPSTLGLGLSPAESFSISSPGLMSLSSHAGFMPCYTSHMVDLMA